MPDIVVTFAFPFTVKNVNVMEGNNSSSDQLRAKEIYKVTFVGSAVNALLVVVKFVAGLLGHSAAMIADAIHSLSDFITDIIVVLFVRISNKPQDKTHDYGHGKYETLATLIIGLILLGVGLGVFWNGAGEIYRVVVKGETLEKPGMIAFWAAVASILFKEALYQYTIRSSRRLESKALIANAWHHRSDVFSSVGTAVGIGGAILLGKEWIILDPIAAVVVSFFICKVAVQLAKPCFDELMEVSLPEDTEQQIINAIGEFPEVSDPHHLRTRRIGNYSAVELHMRMKGDTPLAKAHDTATAVERRIKALLGPKTIVSIHLEPVKEKPSLDSKSVSGNKQVSEK